MCAVRVCVCVWKGAVVAAVAVVGAGEEKRVLGTHVSMTCARLLGWNMFDWGRLGQHACEVLCGVCGSIGQARQCKDVMRVSRRC